jgi:hypothetical protein
MTDLPSPWMASTAIVTDRVPATRTFYEPHFGARAIFDCGRCVQLRIGER